ncbi:MAG TPA: YwqG family protein [Mycobacteriales bacterium]|nr:YwqG family protein [Mycobacteriales bacterium]
MWRRLLGRDDSRGAGRTAPPGGGSAAAPERLAGESDLAYLTRLAEAHLPPAIAAQWLPLLRPAARLLPAPDDAPVVARLGGSPRLPADLPWPVWEGHGPLSFVGEVDLAVLAQARVDTGLQLPAEGRLAFFYFDGSYDDFAGVVGTWDPESLAGARVLHLTDDPAALVQRTAPDRVPVFGERLLTARQATTFPTWEHPALQRVFKRPGEDHSSWMQHPVNAEPFTDALHTLRAGAPAHQIGGWADLVQGPVELEVAHAVLGLGDDWDDPRLEREAERWTLLLQVDSDDDMQWGDVGTLYWLARHDDLAAGDLSRASFTWQCT